MHATLNLLSPEKKAALRSGATFAFAQTVAILLCTVSLFVFGSLLAVRTILVSTLADLTSRSAQGQEEVGTVSKEVRLINDYITRVEDYQMRAQSRSAMLASLAGLVPDGVTLDEIRADLGTVTVSGKAATRDDVLAFRQKLLDSPAFTDVRSPLANILEETDVKFAFTAKIVGWKEKEIDPLSL